ncbi:MAG: transcription antitermination factor NusB, partial [Deltaproteobacteria bacterium]|nr:transcription antitermination factor NusB [Deltaproteobacteria bacterium]
MPISRRKSRELALQILYQIDFTNQPAKIALPLFLTHFCPNKNLDDFITRIVRGIEEYRKEIDRLLREYSEHWTLERMSRVDRNILRMAIYEILWCPDIPLKVSINEAIELGKKFSNEKST